MAGPSKNLDLFLHVQNIYDVARHIWRPEMKRDRESDDEDGDLNHIPIGGVNNSLDRMVGVAEEPRSKKRVRRRSAEAPDTAAVFPVHGIYLEPMISNRTMYRVS
jgi:hypothetical protein